MEDQLDEGPPRCIRVGVVMPSSTRPESGYPVTPGPSPAQVDQFCQALAARIHISVTAQGYSDYRALLSAINQGDADLAWLPPLVALRSASAGRTLPIALPVRGGAAWYSTALIARADSPVRSPEDLVGLHAAWVDRQSTAGYLVIRAWLRSQNVNLAEAFPRETFCGSHEGVAHAVLAGQVDVGATYAHLDTQTQEVVSGGWGDAPVQVVALAGPIPNDVVAASIRLPASTIRTIRDTLVRQDDELRRATAALFDSSGFIAAESLHMEPLTALLKHLDDTGRRSGSVFPGPRR